MKQFILLFLVATTAIQAQANPVEVAKGNYGNRKQYCGFNLSRGPTDDQLIS